MRRETTAGSASAAAVIDALLAAPEGLTRSELRESTGLSPATLVGLLKNANGNSGPSGNGRSAGRLAHVLDVAGDDRRRTRSPGATAVRHRICADVAYVLGIDLGRGHVAVGVGDALGRELRREPGGERWLKRRDDIVVDNQPWAALDTAADFAAELVAELERERGIRRGQFAGIGVAVTSAIEPESGLFRPNWMPDAWHGVRPIKELKERLRARGLTCPLVIDKDANHAAIAEQRWGAGRGVSDFVFVKWSHGVSAGVVMGGELHRGVGGSAGAFGHTPRVKIEREPDEEEYPHEVFEPDPAYRCRRCQKIDCLEALIGIDRLVYEVAKRRQIRDRARWPTLEEIQSAAVADRASLEARVLRAAAKRLGNALGGVANLLNPQFLVIGGSFGREHYDLLAARVQQGLRHVAIAPAYRDVDVLFSEQDVIAGTCASVIRQGKVAAFLHERVLAGP